MWQVFVLHINIFPQHNYNLNQNDLDFKQGPQEEFLSFVSAVSSFVSALKL